MPAGYYPYRPHQYSFLGVKPAEVRKDPKDPDSEMVQATNAEGLLKWKLRLDDESIDDKGEETSEEVYVSVFSKEKPKIAKHSAVEFEDLRLWAYSMKNGANQSFQAASFKEVPYVPGFIEKYKQEKESGKK